MNRLELIERLELLGRRRAELYASGNLYAAERLADIQAAAHCFAVAAALRADSPDHQGDG